MLQNLFATFKVTKEHWNHYPTDLISRYMQLLWHTHTHAHTHTLTEFYSFLKWHFKLANVPYAFFAAQARKTAWTAALSSHEEFETAAVYWCGISADFCPLACLSASETLYISSCWPPAGRGINNNNNNSSHGRTDVDTASLHLVISTESSRPRTLLLCHSNDSNDTSTNTPTHTYTHTHMYAYQYPNHTHSNTSYSTRSSLVCWSLSFLSSWSMYVSARRMQRSTNKQHKQVHWAKTYWTSEIRSDHIDIISLHIEGARIPFEILELSNLFAECSLVYPSEHSVYCKLQCAIIAQNTKYSCMPSCVCVCVTVLVCPYSHSVFI